MNNTVPSEWSEKTLRTSKQGRLGHMPRPARPFDKPTPWIHSLCGSVFLDGGPAKGKGCPRCYDIWQRKREAARRPIWDLDDALFLVRWLGEKLAPYFGVGMTGSVLHEGGSKNDLDIILFPYSTTRPALPADELLVSAGLERRFTAAEVREGWRRKGSTDEKHVEVWTWRGKRVDIFFLQ